MPTGQPFTALCHTLARRRPCVGRADLHVHTTFSDGDHTPAEVVNLAHRAGLAALAITDHDSIEGVAEARSAALGTALEIITGVEISAALEGKDLHLLGYFVREDHPPLRSTLAKLQAHRVERFRDMAQRLRKCGIRLEGPLVESKLAKGCVGRRQLAGLVVQTRQAGSVREVFARYLKEGGPADVPKLRLPVADAIGLVHDAGGVAAWAHPPYDTLQQQGRRLRQLGLDAIEVEYPNRRPATVRSYRAAAVRWGFAVTGGSDYHGPEHARRTVGSCTVSDAEMAALRRLIRA